TSSRKSWPGCMGGRFASRRAGYSTIISPPQWYCSKSTRWASPSKPPRYTGHVNGPWCITFEAFHDPGTHAGVPCPQAEHPEKTLIRIRVRWLRQSGATEVRIYSTSTHGHNETIGDL